MTVTFPAEPPLLEEAVRRMRLAWEDVQRAGVRGADGGQFTVAFRRP